MWDNSKNGNKGIGTDAQRGSVQYRNRDVLMPYYNKKSFSVKKPVRTFRDLEVYQKTIEASVSVFKLKASLAKLGYPFVEQLINGSLLVPLTIGEAHSLRFGDHNNALLLIEKAMAGCNKMVIYLEHILGIYGSKIDRDQIEDLIRKYTDVRGKIFRLEKSWQKWDPPQK